LTLLTMSDPDLLRRFRDGDHAALEVVYRAYIEPVTRVVGSALRRYGGAGGVTGWRTIAIEAPDLVQDVFVRAFEPGTRRRFDGIREYGPYIAQIARHVVADHLRRRRRQVAVESDLIMEKIDLASDTHARAPGSGADGHTMTLVSRYVTSLSPELRRVHELLYVQGLSQRDAAVMLGLGRQVVRTMEAKLRDGLRDMLAQVSRAAVDPEPDAVALGSPTAPERYEKWGRAT
jgi:RNA polymerase sigma factor (sigma-70 family)